MLIEIIEAEKDQFTLTELTVIDWLNEHENRIYDLSISEIAVETFSSPANATALMHWAPWHRVFFVPC